MLFTKWVIVLLLKKSPGNSNEWNFWGWEYCLVKELNLDVNKWVRDNSDYSLKYDKLPNPTGTTAYYRLGEFKKGEKEAILLERIRTARKLKLVDENNKPLAIR